MRDKKYILVMAGVLGLIVIAFVALLLWPAGSKRVPTDESAFPDTSAEREFAPGETADPFADLQPGWMSGAEGGEERAPLLRLVHSGPVLTPSAYTMHGMEGDIATVRYVERTNGHVFDTPLEVVTPATQVLEKTLQRLADSVWARDAHAFLYRYLDEENETVFGYLGMFDPASTTATTDTPSQPPVFSGRPLQNGVVSAAFSPDGTSLFYLVASAAGVTGYLESLSSGTRVEVWSAPLRGITASWTSPETVVLYQNPTTEGEGAVWLLDTTTWKESVVLARERALEAYMNPDGTKLLYSLYEEESGVWALRVMDMTSGEITYLPLPTLAEKCTWAHDNETVFCAVPRNIATQNYLSLWQQGRLQSDDVLWRFNTKTGEAKMILDPMVEAKASFDMINLVADPADSFLVFRTKDREMLWAVRLLAQ